MRRGNLCKAGDNMRPGSDVLYSDTEQFIAELERDLLLQNIMYEAFERSVKRFGYAVDLTDECWRATVAETRVDISKFREHGNIQHSYF